MLDYLNELVDAKWPVWWQEPAPRLNWVLLTNGGSALHDNVVFLGIPVGQREPVLVAKACRWPDHNGTIRHEYRQLSAVWKQLGDKAQNSIPRPLHLGQVGQDAVLVTDFFSGEEMTDSLRGWAKRPDLLAAAFQKLAGWLRAFHEQTAVSITDNCSPFPHYANLFCDMFSLTTAEQTAIARLVSEREAWQQKATKQILQHGDFWPGNIILRGQSQEIALIDWQFSRWTTNASHDLYFLLLASAIAMVQHPSLAVRGRQVAAQLQQWEASWLPDYLDAYGQPAEYTRLEARSGFLSCCVEAAARPMATFGIQQDDASLWRTIFGELVQSLSS